MSYKKKDKLYFHQSFLLIVIYKMMTGLTYLPSLNIPPANQDVWIMLLVSIPYTMIYSLPLLFLSNKFCNYDFLESAELIMGKRLGKIIGIYYSLFFLTNLIFFSGGFIEILDASLYDETPTIVNTLILLFTCAYLVNKGIMNLVRLAELTIPFIIILFFILALLGIDNYDFQTFLPILSDSKFGEINKGALLTTIGYIDILILRMLTTYLDDKSKINRLFVSSLIFSTVMIILSVLVVQATLGIEYAKRVNFPYYTFTRLITIGETQGFDLLYVVAWIIGNVIKASGHLYFTTIALGKVTNKKNQVFIIPVALIATIAIVYIKDNRPILAVRDPYQQMIHVFAFIGVLVIPLMALIVYFFRRDKIKSTINSKEQ